MNRVRIGEDNTTNPCLKVSLVVAVARAGEHSQAHRDARRRSHRDQGSRPRRRPPRLEETIPCMGSPLLLLLLPASLSCAGSPPPASNCRSVPSATEPAPAPTLPRAHDVCRGPARAQLDRRRCKQQRGGRAVHPGAAGELRRSQHLHPWRHASASSAPWLWWLRVEVECSCWMCLTVAAFLAVPVYVVC